MRLEEVVRRLEGAVLHGDGGVEVRAVHLDSRRVGPASLFAALPGGRTHGLRFLDEALARGAVAVLADRAPEQASPVPWIVSPDPRRHVALAAWAVAGDPHRRLLLAGVTGTNGKTSTAHLLADMLTGGGHPAGVLGTLAYRLPGMEVAAERTTPEATELAPLLRELEANGGTAAVIEVSSHGLVQERIAGLQFQLAVFTNLSRDHLDFHSDMDDYFAAKRLLFERHLAPGGRRVLPVDEPAGRRLLAEPAAGDVTYGLASGQVRAGDPHYGLDGTRFELVTPDGRAAVHLPLLGEHNLRNALAAAAAAWAGGIPPAAIRTALAAAQPLSGRLEPIATPLPFPIFVDFAHTPDGLRTVLRSLRGITDRRLVVVFGAGGDKDRGKRAPMGEAVGAVADLAVVTSDNPRSEDPAAIAAAVAEGVRAAGAEPLVVLDRREAISVALARADESCLVVVAGKGHERGQQIGDRTIPFRDQDVIRELAEGMSCG